MNKLVNESGNEIGNEVIDTKNPKFTVYGVMQYRITYIRKKGFRNTEKKELIGTSLYENKTKQSIVIEELQEMERLNKIEAENKGILLLQDYEYKPCEYPVY